MKLKKETNSITIELPEGFKPEILMASKTYIVISLTEVPPVKQSFLQGVFNIIGLN